MPAPNVIVAPSLNTDRRRAQAKLLQAQIIGRGVENVAGIAGQAFETYALLKDKEDTQKLSLLHDIISTYGSEAGQPAFKEYDSILQRKGIGGLPKDPVTGDILPPPKTTAQKVDEVIGNDPNAISELARKKTTGYSSLEESMKKHEADMVLARDTEKTRHDKAMETAAMLRAQRTGLKNYATDQPSPYVMNQDTSEIKTLAPDVPAPLGFTRLKGGQIDRIFKQQDLSNKIELNDANVKLKDADLRAKVMKASNSIAFGAAKGFLNYAIAVHKGMVDPKYKKAMDAAFKETVLRDSGIDITKEEEVKSFWEGWGGFLRGLGPSGIEELKKTSEASTPPSETSTTVPPGGPNVIQLKSGKKGEEYHIPDEGK